MELEYGVCCVAAISVKDIFPNINNFTSTDYICILNDIQTTIINNNYYYNCNFDEFLYAYFELYKKFTDHWGDSKIYANHNIILKKHPSIKLHLSFSQQTKNIFKLIYEKCHPTKLKKYSLIGSITLIIILCILYLYKNMDNFSGGSQYNFTQYNKSNKKLYKTLNKIYTNKIIDY